MKVSINSTNYINNLTYCDQLCFDWKFFVATSLLMSLSIFGMWLSAVLFKLIRQFVLFHANVRLLMLNSCMGNLIVHGCGITKAMYNYAIMIFGVNAVSITKLACIFYELPYCTSLFVFVASMAAITFERFSATIKENVSDPKNSTKTIKLIAISFWFVSVGNTILFIIDLFAYSDYQEIICYCFIILEMSDKMLYIIVVMYMILLLACLISNVYVYQRSRKAVAISINTARHSLQERYQIWNNMATSRMLLPSLICFAFIIILALCFNIVNHSLYWKYKSPNAVNSVVFTTLTLFSMAALVQPILVIVREEKLRSAAAKKYRLFNWLFKSSNRVSSTTTTNSTVKLDRKIVVVPFHADPIISNDIIEKFWKRV